MRIVKVVSLLAVLFAIASFTIAAEGQVLLIAAGATFPYPIYSKWFDINSLSACTLLHCPCQALAHCRHLY